MLGRRGTKQRLEGNRTFNIAHGVTKGLTMLNGNLSNIVQPRVLLVFEGALGFISGSDVEEFNLRASDDRWHEAWKLWTLNQGMMGKIWHVVRNQNINVSLVTFIAPEDGNASYGLQQLMDDHHLPISEVLSISAKRLARELAYMPDVAMVYDANPESWAMFGRKGHALTNVNDFCRF